MKNPSGRRVLRTSAITTVRILRTDPEPRNDSKRSGAPVVTDFDKDFTFSTTPDADALVRRACHRLVNDCCGVTRATPAEDRHGVDYWVTTPRGRIGLDLKLRRKDYGAGRGAGIDCVIELDSHGTGGWLLKAGGAELILFANADTHRCALFHATKLRTAVLLHMARWIADGRVKELNTTSARGGSTWASRAIVVPADLLVQAIDRLDSSDWIGAANDWCSE